MSLRALHARKYWYKLENLQCAKARVTNYPRLTDFWQMLIRLLEMCYTYKQNYCNTLHPEFKMLIWKLIGVILYLYYYKAICEHENKFLNHTSTYIHWLMLVTGTSINYLTYYTYRYLYLVFFFIILLF